MAIEKKIYDRCGNWRYVDKKETERTKIESIIDSYKKQREKEMIEARKPYRDKFPYLPG